MGAILVEDGQSIAEGIFAHIQAKGQDPKLAFDDSEIGQPFSSCRLRVFERFSSITVT
jgi:hypothetical protein